MKKIIYLLIILFIISNPVFSSQNLKIMKEVEQMPEMVDPQTGKVVPKDLDLSVTEKQNYSNENQSHYRYTEEEVEQYEDAGISLGSDPEVSKQIIIKRDKEKSILIGFAISILLAFIFFIYLFTRDSNNSNILKN